MKTLGELLNVDSTLTLFKKEVGTFMASDDFIKSSEYQTEMVPVVDEDYFFNPEIARYICLAFKMSKPLYLFGHSGTGKSSALEQWCARMKRPFMRVQHTAGLEESQVVGQYIVTKDGESSITKFELGPLAVAMKHGMIYCADEYDFAQPSVVAIYQAVLEGKPLIIKEADAENRIIYPHPEFRFCATGNTNGSGDETGLYNGTVLQNTANYERFAICAQVTWMDEKLEKTILKNKTILGSVSISEEAKDLIVDNICHFAKQMRKKFEEGEAEFAPSIRVLMHALDVGWALGNIRLGFQLSYSNRMSALNRIATESVINNFIADNYVSA